MSSTNSTETTQNSEKKETEATKEVKEKAQEGNDIKGQQKSETKDTRDIKGLLNERLSKTNAETEASSSWNSWGGWFSSNLSQASKLVGDYVAPTVQNLAQNTSKLSKSNQSSSLKSNFEMLCCSSGYCDRRRRNKTSSKINRTSGCQFKTK